MACNPFDLPHGGLGRSWSWFASCKNALKGEYHRMCDAAIRKVVDVALKVRKETDNLYGDSQLLVYLADQSRVRTLAHLHLSARKLPMKMGLRIGRLVPLSDQNAVASNNACGNDK